MSRLATIAIVLLGSLASAAHAQFDARAQQQQAARQQQQEQMRRQQEDMRRQQQEQMRQQMQQQQRQQMQQQQREQMQQQQREQARQQQQEMQRQQRQQQSSQSRQQAQDAQRQAQQNQQRQAQQNAAQAQRTHAAGLSDRRTFSNGVSKSVAPPTNAQLAKGYTGKQTLDGRALVKVNNRILAVPASRIGLKSQPATSDRGTGPTSAPSTWSAQKQSAVRADVQKLASAAGGGGSGKGRGGEGAGGNGAGLSKVFNAAAGKRIESAKVARANGMQMGNVQRVNAAVVNIPYLDKAALEKGWKGPGSLKSGPRNYVSQRTERFVRVHTDKNRPGGSFMVREKEIAHLGNDAEKIRVYLGLPYKPQFISDVDVPAGTQMQVSVIGKNFDKETAEGFQYITMDELPREAYTNTRELK
ncbi:hypothetical protein ACG02S_14335 [Roseateles sp. DC23W]|uniref:Uncharacterized protein n=1 Tax=Pelomonas dachongensis TaxID=3299029 RepID=A0ABW7EQD1_9BURK